MTPTKEHWQVNTERIARLILDAAAKSHSKDLDIAVEPGRQSPVKRIGPGADTIHPVKEPAVLYGIASVA